MATAYYISKDEALITVRIDEQIDLRALLVVTNNLLSDADYDPALALLLDLRGMQLDLTAAKKDSFNEFNEFIIAQFGSGRQASSAVVIDPDLEANLCAAIYKLCCAIKATELFDDYDLALKWLFKRELGLAQAGKVKQA
ncbi:MAG: hypothetical protein O6766_02820 [Gammaproteobacteria bacterium]|nr:hypothetical protein [Gammaproteobacteria bacterium]